MTRHNDSNSSPEIEKDIEAGVRRETREDCKNETSSVSSKLSSDDYDEGIRRIATLVNPEVTRIATKASRVSGRSGKTSKDLAAVLDTEFEVKWNGPNDPQNALNWSSLRKYWILALVSLQTWMVYVH